MSKYLYALLFGIILCFTNCQKILFDIPDEVTNTLVFEEVWQYMKQHYCCFDVKNVDWEAVREIYTVQIDDDMNEDEFKSIIHAMLSELEDGTLSFATSTESVRYEDYYLPYPENLDENVRTFNYPGNSAFWEDTILYINSFADVIDGFSPVPPLMIRSKALIIDLRNMTKRPQFKIPYSDNDIVGLADALQPTQTVGTERTKIGIGADEYDDVEFEVGGGWFEVDYPFPVILLCNRQTFAEGNVSAFAFAQLPNCTIIGDRTGGGNLDLESFILSNGWLLNLPKTTILDLDGNSIGNGIAPDIFVNDDPATTDKDEIIEKALELLR